MTTLPLDASEPPASEAAGLVAALQERLLVLRRRTTDPASVDRRIALAGGLLVALGFVLVLLGWYGAAHTSRVYLQIPYLISGGLLGVVLALAGASAYLASWLTRLVQDQRDRDAEATAATRDVAAALARIEALLAGAAPSGRGASPAAPTAEAAAVATPSGRLAHRVTCPAVAGRDDLRSVTVGPGGLDPCRMCEPVTTDG